MELEETVEEVKAVEVSPEAPESIEDAPDTFPREYVQKLRRESARYREKAKKADELARELFQFKVEATGRLADSADLPFDEELLNNDEALNEAIDELLNQHPHYASRRPFGDIQQGATANNGAEVNLAELLRNSA